ncbi:transcriptional regulator [Methanobrevibacter sp.]
MVDKLKYVKRSSYRVNVLKAIGDDVKIPTEIAEDSGVLRNHVSNVLRELKEKDLVECVNPNSRKGRLYRLSDEGFKILDDIK